MTVDPKIIAAMRRAIEQMTSIRPLHLLTNAELSALAAVVLHPVDPDEEWREAEQAYCDALGGEFTLADVKDRIARLRAAVPISPPYKALQARLDEAVELLRQSAAQFKPGWGLKVAIHAFLDKHKEQQP